MNKKQHTLHLLGALLLILTLCACHSEKNIIYLQDIEADGQVAAQAEHQLTFQPGDKMAINVNSALTPDLAIRYTTPLIASKTNGMATAQNQTLYTVNDQGYITVPGLEPVKAAGLTRSQLAQTIQDRLRQDLLRDAVVTVDCYQRYVTILGEVKAPGRFDITKDRITILEALGAAGDLTIQGKREDVLVIREEGGQRTTYHLDLRSKDIFSSPAYYLQQNDVVYVSPNKMRTGQSTINDNSFRSVATWLSMASVLTSITILITNAVK
ncbi:MAG: polysaccharide biosynthesis/export family protein [Bacteroidaceae bacterium]|nr:polysaccharide biosynthesis/export family protein [Candidatus Equimonas faecalis]MCQ2206437.1 polysaccharide biosynthesis/export family protein [Bacteroidaceae bacterium]